MTPIMQQLKDFCDCLPERLDDESFLEKAVNEMIHLVSLLTCWTQEPCETFLNSERKEVLDVKAFDPCACEGGLIHFTPFFTPFNPLTFNVSLIQQHGVQDEVIVIDSSDYAFSEIFSVLKVNLKGYIPAAECGCPSRYKLVITYDAGYELIPECLLPLFCDLLHVISDKNNCDCSNCQACKGDNDDNEGVIDWGEGDKASPIINRYLNVLINNGYQKQLGLISLCKCRKPWWVIV